MRPETTPTKATLRAVVGPSRFYQALHVVALVVFAASTSVALAQIIASPVFETSSAIAAIVGPLFGACVGVSLWQANAARIVLVLAAHKKVLHVSGPGRRRSAIKLLPDSHLVVADLPVRGASGITTTTRAVWLTSESGQRQLVVDRLAPSRRNVESLLASLNQAIGTSTRAENATRVVREPHHAPVSGLHVRGDLLRVG